MIFFPFEVVSSEPWALTMMSGMKSAPKFAMASRLGFVEPMADICEGKILASRFVRNVPQLDSSKTDIT